MKIKFESGLEAGAADMIGKRISVDDKPYIVDSSTLYIDGSGASGVTLKEVDIPDLVPQTKEVEWVNGLPPVGAECVFTPHNMQWGFNHIEDFTGTVLHYEGEQFVFMLNHVKYKLEGDMVVVSRTDKGDFSKPETQEDREKRERMESAYDLYLTRHQGMTAPYHYDEFLKNDQTLNGFLAIVDKTEYRKGGE